MAMNYLPGHPRKRQVAIVRERLLTGEPAYPVALIDAGIAKPSRVILLLRRAGLPIVTTFEEELLTAEEASDMADIDGLEEAQETGEQSRTVAYYWMRPEEIARNKIDPDGQREDMRLIFRMNQEKRRCGSAVGLFKSRAADNHITPDIRRDSELPIPANTDGRSTITEEARALIAQHQAEKNARLEAANDAAAHDETTEQEAS